MSYWQCDSFLGWAVKDELALTTDETVIFENCNVLRCKSRKMKRRSEFGSSIASETPEDVLEFDDELHRDTKTLSNSSDPKATPGDTTHFGGGRGGGGGGGGGRRDRTKIGRVNGEEVEEEIEEDLEVEGGGGGTDSAGGQGGRIKRRTFISRRVRRNGRDVRDGDKEEGGGSGAGRGEGGGSGRMDVPSSAKAKI